METQVSQTQTTPTVAPPNPPSVTYAGFWKRVAASLLDGLFIFMPFLVIDILFSTVLFLFFPLKSNPAMRTINNELVQVLNSILYILYFAYTESSSMQATYGKKVMKIIVTDAEGKRLTFMHALGRELSKLIDGLIGLFTFLLGLIVVLGMAGWTKKKQALHDKIADTLVINSPLQN